MIKRGNLLDSHFALSGPVNGRAYDAIGTFTNNVEYLILSA